VFVRSSRFLIGAIVATFAGVTLWMLPPGREPVVPVFAAPRERPDWKPAGQSKDAARAELLRNARVWTETDPARADLTKNPPDSTGALSEALVRCRYVSSAAHGTTAKFDCVLPDGEVVKVKYGHTGEIHAEVAATRLLSALGFGADRMFLIPRLRCYGCLRNPFYAVVALDYVRAREVVTGSIPDERYTDFEWVAVERRFDGIEVETEAQEGWSWFELDAVDPAHGANRTERDALRLLAMFLAHWDNKAANQRLVVRPEPFAYIHDLGATFGPNKLDLDGWQQAPVWSDRATCSVSMKRFPYGGGTFPDARISEAGRELLVRQLSALDDQQVLALFTAARFTDFDPSTDVKAWAETFWSKVQQIAAGGPCG
jgi:hypothetical protein